MFSIGYWDVLRELASKRELAAFERCPGLLPCLAASGQYELLASALCQVRSNIRTQSAVCAMSLAVQSSGYLPLR